VYAVLCSSDIAVGQRWCTDGLSSRINFSFLQRNLLPGPADESWEFEETIVPGVRDLALIIECDSIWLALGRSGLFPKPQHRKCLNYTKLHAESAFLLFFPLAAWFLILSLSGTEQISFDMK